VIAGGAPEVIAVIAGNSGTGRALNGLPVRIVCNREQKSDMAGSVRVGLRDVRESATGVLVCLADHPLVSPDTVRLLLEEHAARPERIIIPVHCGRRGHPTLFPRAVISGQSPHPS
jgi:CTP:molybdopterin cytidylyltransferase MocA